MKKENVLKSRIFWILFSVGITGVFFYFSIPTFPSKEKITNLLTRIDSYQEEKEK